MSYLLPVEWGVRSSAPDAFARSCVLLSELIDETSGRQRQKIQAEVLSFPLVYFVHAYINSSSACPWDECFKWHVDRASIFIFLVLGLDEKGWPYGGSLELDDRKWKSLVGETK